MALHEIKTKDSKDYDMDKVDLYEVINTSERQIKDGKVKDAKKSLAENRKKYNI